MEKDGKRRDSTRIEGKWVPAGVQKLAKAVAAAQSFGPRRAKINHSVVSEDKSNMVVVVEAGRRSVSQLESNAPSVAAFLQVKVVASDMPEFMQVHAFRCARRTYDSLEKFSHKHMAYNIKKEFDRVYGRAWHCIVGPNFGSFVTHATGCFLYFSMEKIHILVYKTKVG